MTLDCFTLRGCSTLEQVINPLRRKRPCASALKSRIGRKPNTCKN